MSDRPTFEAVGRRWSSDCTVLVREDCPSPTTQGDLSGLPWDWIRKERCTQERWLAFLTDVTAALRRATTETTRPVPASLRCAGRMLPVLAAGDRWRHLPARGAASRHVIVYRAGEVIAFVAPLRRGWTEDVIAFDGREWREVPRD